MVAGVSYKIWEETDFGFYGDETLVLVGRGILGRSRKRVAFLEPLLYDRKNCSAIRMKRRMILKRNKKVTSKCFIDTGGLDLDFCRESQPESGLR